MADPTPAAPARKKAPARPRRKPAQKPKMINLAFQGGGSHGAFTWGVVDRLLEEGTLEIEGITGTSAGAMNACVLAYGYAEGGRQGAREALDKFWRAIADAGRGSPIQRPWWEKARGSYRLDTSPGFMFMDFMNRMFSPYQLNPFNFNPLRDVLLEHIDFDVLRFATGIKLFVSATNVRTGKIRVFENREMCPEAILASACLPFMFQTVEYKGEAYWDGGYMGNPALFPLFYNCKTPDVLIVQINPLYRDDIPKTARDILDRVNEISFNSSLMREMRNIHFVTRLIEAGHLDPAKYKQVHIHKVAADAEMKKHGASSKLNAELAFLLEMRDSGRAVAEQWLKTNWQHVGERSSVDLVDTYM